MWSSSITAGFDDTTLVTDAQWNHSVCPFPMQRSDALNTNASTTRCLIYCHLLGYSGCLMRYHALSVDHHSVCSAMIFLVQSVSSAMRCLSSAQLQCVSSAAICKLRLAQARFVKLSRHLSAARCSQSAVNRSHTLIYTSKCVSIVTES